MAYASGTAFDLTNYRPGFEPPQKSPESSRRKQRNVLPRGFAR